MDYLKSRLPPAFFEELKAVYDEKLNTPFSPKFNEDLKLKIIYASRFGTIMPNYWQWHDDFVKDTDEQKQRLQAWFDEQIRDTQWVNLYESSYIYTIQCAHLDALKLGKIMAVNDYENYCQRLLDKTFA